MTQGVPARQTLPLFDRAEALAREVRDWKTLAWICNDRGSAYWHAGDLWGALADYRLTLDLAERSGTPLHQMYGLFNAAYLLEELGDWAAARALYERADTLEDMVAAQYREARALWLRGRWDAGWAALQLLLDELHRRGSAHFAGLYLTMSADMLLQLGGAEAAVAKAQQAHSLATARGQANMRLLAGAVLTEALALMGAPEAESVLAAEERAAAASECGWGAPRLLRVRGLLQARRGDHAGALTSLGESAAAARGPGALVELARTLHTLAETARVVGDEATAAAAGEERRTIVTLIGPETRGLIWARGVWE